MPDFMISAREKHDLRAAAADPSAVQLPGSVWRAIARGLFGRCPRCGQVRLFRAFLKPVDACKRCGQDWSLQRADDFPAYVSLFLTGHLMAPVLVYLAQHTSLSVVMINAIALPAVLVLSVGLLQPSKGAIIAVQWWMGMHGFVKERASGEPVPENGQ